MKILVDVDGVLADQMTEWINKYNWHFDDKLSVEDITSWDMTKFVKPECGNKIYEYLDMVDMYDNVKPIPGAGEGIRSLRNWGHRVIFATAGVGSAPAKFKWLRKHDFKPGIYGEDFVSIYDKSLLIGNILIDDKFENVRDFCKIPYRDAILFNAPYNMEYDWPLRADNWYSILQIIKFGFSSFERKNEND